MKNQLKIKVYSFIVHTLLLMLCGMQQTQIGKNVIVIFGISLLYVAIFCVIKNKKLPLKSIEFFQCLAIGSGFFLLVQFFIMSHDKYKYFFLIISLVTILRINDQFDNEKVKNNLK